MQIQECTSIVLTDQKTFKFSVGFLSIPGARLALKKKKKTSTSLSYIATSVLYQDVKEN